MADRDILKKIGTGIYAGLDEFLFNVPDLILSKVNKNAYNKFKEYRKNEGATAEKIGDVASILGDIALLPLGGAGAAKLGSKLGLKSAKTAAKIGKTAGVQAVKGVVGAGKAAMPAMGTIGKIGMTGLKGAARNYGETLARSYINPDDEEKDALKQNIGMSALLGGVGGGLVGGIGSLRKIAKSGNVNAMSGRIADDLKVANAMDSLKEKGIGSGYRRSLNKTMRNAGEDFIKKDAQELNEVASKLWNEAKEKGLDFSDLVKNAKSTLSAEYDTIYRKAAENHGAIKNAVKNAVFDSVMTDGKIDINKLNGDDWRGVLKTALAKGKYADGGTADEINKIFNKALKDVTENADSAITLTELGDAISGAMQEAGVNLSESGFGKISKGIRDAVLDAISENGGGALKDVNKKYRHLQTILDAGSLETKKEIGKKASTIADSLAAQISGSGVMTSLATGALSGGGTLAAGGDLKDVATASLLGLAGGTVANALVRNQMSDIIARGTMAARGAAADALEKGLLDNLAKAATSKTGGVVSALSKNAGDYIARNKKEIPTESKYSDERRRQMADELFNQRLAAKRAQIDEYNRRFPDFAVNPDDIMRNLEAQREAFTSKEGTLSRIGDKDLTKLARGAELLRAGATGQEAFYAFRQMGLSEKETEKAIVELGKYRSKTFRDNFIKKLLEKQAKKTLSPEAYQYIEEGLI